MFNQNSAFFFLLTIFACYSTNCADVLESKEERLIGGTLPGATVNRQTVASIRLQMLQMSFHVCGGFIINKHWVGTAAQCLTNKTIYNTVVAVGSTSITGGTIYNLERIEKHQNYSVIAKAIFYNFFL